MHFFATVEKYSGEDAPLLIVHLHVSTTFSRTVFGLNKCECLNCKVMLVADVVA